MTLEYARVLDYIQKDFPYPVRIKTFDQYVDALTFLNERVGDCARWIKYQSDGDRIVYANPDAEWETHEAVIMCKDFKVATEIKLRFG